MSPLDSHSPQVTLNSPQVVVESLVKQYGPLRALDDVSFTVASRRMGRADGTIRLRQNHLINILGGLDTLTSGRVIVDDVDLAKRTESQLVRFARKK